MKLLCAFLLAACMAPSSVFAADVGAPAKLPPALIKAPPSLASYLGGFYVGPALIGTGSTVQDSNTGIPQNAFSSGGGVGLDVGYLYWQGPIVFGVEVFCAASTINLGTGNGFRTGFLCGELGKVGVGFAGLLGGAGSGVTAPSQSPVSLTVPAGLQQGMFAPYAAFGAVNRPWGTGWAVGGGVTGIIAANWNWDALVMHVDYNNAAINPLVNQQTETLAKLGLHFHM